MRNLSFFNKIIYLFNSICLIFLLLSYIAPYINPYFLWPISFFGLLFPILYIINILFLVYWIICFKKQVFSNLIILMIGINYLGLYIGPNNRNNVTKNKIKILSYNVRLFNYYEWIKHDNIKEKIISFIKSENADIICLQEFYKNETIKLNNYPFEHIKSKNNDDIGSIAILSKYPQINKGFIKTQGKSSNIFIYSDIVINFDTIRIYNIHLVSNWFNNGDYEFLKNPNKSHLKNRIIGIVKKMKNSYQARSKEVEVINNHIQQSNYPVILAGDFNDTPLSYAYNSLKKTLLDSFENSGKGVGQSFIKIPALRIDYILHSKNINSYNYKQHKEKYSDHLPISCEIEIPIP